MTNKGDEKMERQKVMGAVFKVMEVLGWLLCGYNVAIDNYILAGVYGAVGLGFEILVLKVG